MRQFTRLDTPQYLADNWEKWSERYAQNKTQDTSHTFKWVTHEGQRLNQKLLPLLTQQTQAHCSYCDAYRCASKLWYRHFHHRTIASLA